MTRAFICGCAGSAFSDDERAFVRKSRPWGLILFRRNVVDRRQLAALASDFRALAERQEAPILIDQEGGRVQRLASPNWRVYPPAARFESLPTLEVSERAAWLTARLIAYDLREVGVTVNCAPVLDVGDELTHAVIGSRAFSSRPDIVARLARRYRDGLTDGAVAPVIKHIPGHGRTRVDSHLELPTVDAQLSDLAAKDFVPFIALRDTPIAMSAHIVFRSVDAQRAATVSPVVVADVIRRQIGFEGLLLSDDLSMNALKGSLGDRARAAFDAGIDVALHCNGNLAEAQEIASAAPLLEGISLKRAEIGLLATQRQPTFFDPVLGAKELFELLPPAD